jgi:hypothetical protein
MTAAAFRYYLILPEHVAVEPMAFRSRLIGQSARPDCRSALRAGGCSRQSGNNSETKAGPATLDRSCRFLVSTRAALINAQKPWRALCWDGSQPACLVTHLT